MLKQSKQIPSEALHPVRAWYGLPAEIAVEDGLWHLVRVGGISLHHPPVVNLILRRGLPREDRLRLSFLHEFGHLQTLPIALAHVLLLLFFGRLRGKGLFGTLFALFKATVAHQAVWELASEAYVVARTGPEYRRIYREHPNPAGHAVFWSGMVFLATAFTFSLRRR